MTDWRYNIVSIMQASSIGELESRIVDLENRMDAVEADVQQNKTDISLLTTRVGQNEIDISNIDVRVTTNEQRITVNESDIAGLDTRVTTNESDIAGLDTRVTTNESAISANRTDIDTNTAGISALDTRVTENESDIAANAVNIATNQTDIATNKQDIATNAANIAANRTDIDANRTDIDTNAAAIAVNQADIATNRQDIATNAAAIAVNQGDIAALQTRVTNIEEITTAFDEVGGVTITGVTQIPITLRYQLGDSVTVVNNTIVVNDTGVHMIILEAADQLTSGQPSTISRYGIELDTGSGFVQVPNFEVYMEGRDAADSRASNLMIRGLELNTGDVIRMVGERTSGNAGISTIPSRCGIIIDRII